MPITKFTNCRLLKQTTLIDDPNQTLWVDSATGKILNGQHAFYEHHLCPDETVDLGGRILAPGFIEAQLNGAFGFDFSVPAASKRDYEEGLRGVKKGLVREGVTGFLPTVVSSRDEVYWEVGLPLSINWIIEMVLIVPRFCPLWLHLGVLEVIALRMVQSPSAHISRGRS